MERISVLFENEEILVVNKPFGLAVQGGKGVGRSLDDELSAQVGYRVHLVHRLDKDTSGILVVAKNTQSAAKWTSLIGGGLVKKQYMAVCTGEPYSGGTGNGKIETSVTAHGKVQSALTYFTVEKRTSVAVETEGGLKEIPLFLLKLELGTGRMHQLRIQLAGARSPIAADDQHGDFKTNKLLRKVGIKKLQLAAVCLNLKVPGVPEKIEIPLPFHMQETLEKYFGY